MKRDKWPVVGDTDCIYCHQAPRTEHKVDCVTRKQTVVVDVKIRLVTRVPEFWDKDKIEFHYNQSSSCADNLLPNILALKKHQGCLCNAADTVFVREADAVDEEKFGVTVNDVPEETEGIEHEGF